MRLLPKKECKKIEEILRTSDSNNADIKKAVKEIKDFFEVEIYADFLKLFYFERYKYINRYIDNRSMMKYLSERLYSAESQLYVVRKEIIYKSAMIFYKNDILK